jgi:hypothetical protein
MLEKAGALETWEIESIDFTRPQRAVQKPDHRTAYLEYEGPVSGNRGKVKRVDEGKFERRPASVVFAGRILNGEFVLGPTRFYSKSSSRRKAR